MDPLESLSSSSRRPISSRNLGTSSWQILPSRFCLLLLPALHRTQTTWKLKLKSNIEVRGQLLSMRSSDSGHQVSPSSPGQNWWLRTPPVFSRPNGHRANALRNARRLYKLRARNRQARLSPSLRRTFAGHHCPHRHGDPFVDCKIRKTTSQSLGGRVFVAFTNHM